jgi:D-glycero-alpha-D-manno-heptose 1-phosphate guanylyltransferase
MAPVGGAPFLQYVLGYLRAWQVERVILCVGHQRETIIRYFGSGREFGVEIEYSVEDTLRGTGGAIAQAAPLVEHECFWVLNGDTFCDVNLVDMQALHARCSAMATVALSKTHEPARYGSISLDPDGQIREFKEKSGTGQSAPGGQLINAGLYLFRKEILDLPLMSQEKFSMESEVLPSLIGKGLYGFIAPGNFIDIGIPADYAAAQKQLPEWFERAQYDHPR